MPELSVIIPAYNNSRYLPECVHSVTKQSFPDVEVIIVDDASTDDTYDVARQLAANDPRITAIRHDHNAGTLAARRTGMEHSSGDFVMLIDQDDELADESLPALIAFAHSHPADIYHFGVRVSAATPAAQQAAPGMTGFLTPQPRELRGEDILRTQFAQEQGFDWHVHHKMYRGDLARKAYAMSANTRLLLSDDLYMCFILDSLAECYRAIPDSPWYIYHLGRGETLGQHMSVDSLSELAHRDAKALTLISDFVRNNHNTILRSDWDARLSDVRDRLIEHAMNEWQDNLAEPLKHDGLNHVLDCWPADAVCGELYRYTRDYAYAYLVTSDRTSTKALSDADNAKRYLDMAQSIERDHATAVSNSANERYHAMRAIAYQHLRDSGLDMPPSHRPSFVQRVLKRLIH
ncbi:glycosyltransferase family 2 protein [Bifidobacterium oedipodis]|uniref:Glycosyltransferase, group 2 family protein n=1 Tax=Bifidobacterium oedipodis TaxID=2675322 RepID=A0A7Y0ERG9_9BIFI|nr:glycosyltransferase family 2 protein [Bifidobacterium sp. DSM 109957]NMM95090.1 glycosyltransferase, group 2 family protein [Bifidobacterium sp. DSM 109957]